MGGGLVKFAGANSGEDRGVVKGGFARRDVVSVGIAGDDDKFAGGSSNSLFINNDDVGHGIIVWSRVDDGEKGTVLDGGLDVRNGKVVDSRTIGGVVGRVDSLSAVEDVSVEGEGSVVRFDEGKTKVGINGRASASVNGVVVSVFGLEGQVGRNASRGRVEARAFSLNGGSIDGTSDDGGTIGALVDGNAVEVDGDIVGRGEGGEVLHLGDVVGLVARDEFEKRGSASTEILELRIGGDLERRGGETLSDGVVVTIASEEDELSAVSGRNGLRADTISLGDSVGGIKGTSINGDLVRIEGNISVSKGQSVLAGNGLVVFQGSDGRDGESKD